MVLRVLFQKSIFDDTINGSETIFPIYLLAFGVGASIIRYAHFIDAYVGYSGYFGRNFWLKAKSFFFQIKSLNHIYPEKFITGFHICQVQVIEHITQKSKPFIAD
jgi:hypothetical protein